MRWTGDSEQASEYAGWPRAAAAWLAVAVVAAWLPGLAGSFQFDDWNVVVRDPRVQDLAAWWAGMPGIRPLTKLTYAIDHVVDRQLGLGVAGFRATSLAIHLATALLAFALLRHCLRWSGVAAAPGGGAAVRAALVGALVGALVFALHPVQTEAVTYVAGRSSALAGALSLASALAWLAGREGRGGVAARVGSVVLFALALAARETAVVLPLALLLLEGLRRGAPDGAPAGPAAAAAGASSVGSSTAPRGLAVDLLPHALLVLLLAAMVLVTEPYAGFVTTGLAVRDPATNLLVQARAVGYLTGQWFWPVALNADPDLPALPAPGLAGLLPFVVVLGVLAVAASQWRHRRWLAVGILWYGLWLLPGNSLLARLDVANDRQLYLASLGPSLLLAVLVAQVLTKTAGRWPGAPRAWLALLLVATLVPATATVLRNRVYRSEVAFWTDVVARSPRKARPANNLGYALALACRPAAAAREFDRAAALDPGYARPRVNARLLAAGRLPGATAADCPPGGGAFARGAITAD